MTASSVHFLSTYYLPSWQGGDVHVPRCERTVFGWTREPNGLRMSDELSDVTCIRCRRFVANGWGANLR